MGARINISDIKEQVAQLDPELHPNDNSFKAGVLLFALLLVKPDCEALYRFTGYSRKRVPIAKMLNNFFHGNYEATSFQWLESVNEGAFVVDPVVFWLDALVLCGKLNRSIEAGEAHYCINLESGHRF